MKRYLQSLVVLGIFALYSYFLTPHIFAAGNLYLTPGSLTGGSGSNISVSIRANITSDTVNAVQANLTYPADKLDFVGINAASSPFNIQAESTGGGGFVKVARGIVGTGVTGDRLIAVVTFKVKQNSGTASIGFAGDSALVSGTSNSNVLSGTSGSTVTFSKAVPTPIPTIQATNSIEVSEINVAEVTYNSATITWNTNIAANSTVEYGLSDQFGLTAHQDTATISHRLVLDSPLISPGTTYTFRVKSASGSENEVVSDQMTFTTKGYTALLKIEGQDEIPLANVNVTVSSPNGPITQKTDGSGYVTFTNLPAGIHIVVVETPFGTESSTIEISDGEEVSDDSESQPQQFTILVAGASDSLFDFPRQTLLVIMIPAIIILLGVILFIIFRISRNNTGQDSTYDNTGNTVNKL